MHLAPFQVSECARAGNPGNQKSNKSGGEMCGLLERQDPVSALGPAPQHVGEKLPEKASVAQVLVDQSPQPAGVGLLFLTQGAGKIAPLFAWQMLQMLDRTAEAAEDFSARERWREL